MELQYLILLYFFPVFFLEKSPHDARHGSGGSGRAGPLRQRLPEGGAGGALPRIARDGQRWYHLLCRGDQVVSRRGREAGACGSDFSTALSPASMFSSTFISRAPPATTTSPVCALIFQPFAQLDDEISDVKSRAVNCVRLLAAVAPADDIVLCAAKMSTSLLNNDDTDVSIYEMGLSAVLGAAPPRVSARVAKSLVTDIVVSMKNTTPTNDGVPRLLVSCMVLLKDVLGLSGAAAELRPFHADVLEALMSVLHSPSPSVRSSAIACLGVLAVHLDVNLLNTLSDTLLTQIDSREGSRVASGGEGKEADVNTSIQAFSLVSKNVGHRLGSSLERIVPLFLSALGDPGDIADDAATDAKCAIKENILVALRRCVDHCPGQINTFMDDIVDTMFGFMRFDPNFCEEDGGDDDDFSEPADSEDEDEDDNDSNDDYSSEEDDDEDYEDDDDDEDASWKVRRAAVRVIRSFISSRPDLLSTMYNRCLGLMGEDGPGPLVARFLERNAVVRVEVIMCARDLMRASSRRHRLNSENKPGMLCGVRAGSESRARVLLRQRSDYRVLADKSNSIMSVVERMLGSSIVVCASSPSEQKVGPRKSRTKVKAVWLSAQVRNELWKMLREWLYAISAETESKGDSWDETTEAVLPLVPYVVASLDSKTSMPSMRFHRYTETAEESAKIGAISFLAALVQSEGKAAIRPCLSSIVAHVEACARSNMSKLRCEAMSFVSAAVLSGVLSAPDTEANLSPRLFATCTHCLQDAEVVVKATAVKSASLLLSRLWSKLQDDSVSEFWSLLVPQIAVSSSTGEVAMEAVQRIAECIKGSSKLGLGQVTCMALFRTLTVLVKSPHSSMSAQRQALRTTNVLLKSMCRESSSGSPPAFSSAEAVELVLPVAADAATSEGTDDDTQSLLALDILTTILSIQDGIFSSRAYFGKASHAPTCQAVINACVGLACRDQVGDDPASVTDSITSCIHACMEAGIIKDAAGLSERLHRQATSLNTDADANSALEPLPVNAATATSALVLAAGALSKTQYESLMGSLEAKLVQEDTTARGRELALRVLGEVGRARDISDRPVFQRQGGAVMACLEAKDQDEREAASWCIGSVASHNVSVMLSTLLEKCQAQGTRESALAALKGMLVLCSAGSTSPRKIFSGRKASANGSAVLPEGAINLILEVLVQCIVSSENDAGVYETAADCWGYLATLDAEDGECISAISRTLRDPTTVGGASKSGEGDGAAGRMRLASVIALTVLVRKAEPSAVTTGILSANSDHWSLLIDMMRTQTENVPLRNRILTLFCVLMRCRRSVVLRLVKESDKEGLLPTILECAQYSRKEKVDHGAFTMIIDHGDTLRLGALDSLRDLLVFARSQIKGSIGRIVETVAKCAGDANEGVRQAAHRILETLCRIAPADILTHLSVILEGMQKVDLKVKSRGKVKIVSISGDSRDSTKVSCVSLIGDWLFARVNIHICYSFLVVKALGLRSCLIISYANY